jgi:PAS domain S-box-containing protein
MSQMYTIGPITSRGAQAKQEWNLQVFWGGASMARYPQYEVDQVDRMNGDGDSEEQSSIEAQLRATANLIPAHVWYASPSGALVFVNSRIADYIGLTRDDPLRFGIDLGGEWDSHIRLLHPEDHEETHRVWSTCLRTGSAGKVAFRLRNADGGYRWFLSRVEPVRTSDGTLVYWIGINLDIDERQQAEFYLAEGQRLAHTGSWTFNTAGFEHWSSELFQIHGLDPGGKAPAREEYLALVHPEDREFVGRQFQEMLTTHRAFEFTKRIVRHDGEVRYVRCVGAPVLENGRLKQLVGTAMDVTEREFVTRELRRREVHLAEAQRLSHTGSFGWNVSTDEHFWSDETFRIFEFPHSWKITLPMILERVHPQDRPSVRMALGAAVDGEGIDVECRLLLSDGRIKYLHVVGKAERDRTGNIEVIGAAMDVTARKLIEVELRRNKAHLADAQRLSRTGSAGMEAGTKRMFWSEETARIYGYAPGTEPTPDLILQRVHPDDVELLKTVLERAGQGGSDFDFEHRLLMPDGSIKHIHSLAHSLRDEDGNEESVGAIMDITERRVAEDAIRRSEADLAEAQRLSHTGSFGWKTDNGEIVWSDETYRIFESDRGEKPTLDIVIQRIHPDDRPFAQQVIERASETGEDFEHEYRLLMPNGRIKHVHVRAHALGDSSSGFEFVGAVSDITKRKEAEQRLQQQEAELRQILDLAPQLIGVYGPNRERLHINRTALDYAGLSLEEWRQTSDRSAFVHPDDRARDRDYFDRALSAGLAYELELRLRKGDGTYRWFLARSNPVREDNGQIRRWYVTCTDIEDRKRAEESLQRENAALREELNQASMFEEIVGSSEPLCKVLSQISKVAVSDSTVLILGQTGTGKELVARAIHKRSRRVGRAFIGVNCGAIPASLIASELFGHEKGAFTGATHRRLGRFEAANGGTIFLDEVGDLPPDIQIALLRVLQEREIERVGSDRPIPVDVRVLAATHRDLDKLVSEGKFRQDLLYRLNVVPIAMPSLRERAADIPILVEYFIAGFGRKVGKKFQAIEKKTLKMMQEYDWPGNVRELQNVIERAVTLSDSDTFAVDEAWLKREPSEVPHSSVALNGALAAHEKEVIEAALAQSHGRISGPAGAASRLGIPDSTLEAKVKRLGIDKYRFKSQR